MMKNQNGLGTVGVLAFIFVICVIGFTGWYVWDNNQTELNSGNKTSTVAKEKAKDENPPERTFDPIKASNIKGFELASKSLKAALIDVYYDDAKKNCDTENANIPNENDKIKKVLFVSKMVRDEFAGVQFCGSGGTSVFVKEAGSWKVKTSLADTPGCVVVDKYKISREITSICYTGEGGTTREVTYP